MALHRNVTTPMTKPAIVARLKRAFWLRMHAFVLVTWCGGIGFASTKGLHHIGIDNMGWRYGLSVLASYLALLVGVRLWLYYVGLGAYRVPHKNESYNTGNNLDGIDVPFNLDGTPVSMERLFTPGVQGHGGTFDGGGASGDWLSSDAPAVVAGGSSLGGGDLDGECWPLFVVLAIAAAILFVLFGGIYLGTELLTELAFQVLLAAVMRKSLKDNSLSWWSVTVKNTWWALVLVFVTAVGIGMLAEHTYHTHTAAETVNAMLAQAKDRAVSN